MVLPFLRNPKPPRRPILRKLRNSKLSRIPELLIPILLLLILAPFIAQFHSNSSLVEAAQNPTQATWSQQLAPPIDNIDQFIDTCPTSEDLQRISSDFSIFLDGSVAAGRPYHCSEPVSQMPKESLSESLLIFQALRLILHMKLNSPLPWTNLHPYEWLRSTITGFSVQDNAQYAGCCISVGSSPHTVVLRILALNDLTDATQFMIENPFSPGARVTVGIVGEMQLIMHEARHAENKFHTCNDYADDVNLQYMGAWAVPYYVLGMIAQGQIEIGIKNSRIAGDYITGIVTDLQYTYVKRFCTQPTVTSITVNVDRANVEVGTNPPEYVTITAMLTPKIAAEPIILLDRETGQSNKPAVLISALNAIGSEPLVSGLTDTSGEVTLRWMAPKEGAYLFEGLFAGDTNYGPTTATGSQTVTVTTHTAVPTTRSSTVQQTTQTSGSAHQSRQSTASVPKIELTSDQVQYAVVIAAILLVVVTIAALATKRKPRPPSISQPPVRAGVSAGFCVSCGAPLRSNVRFCGRCGAQISPGSQN